MSVLLQFCFIHVVGGYVNVAQISRVADNSNGKITIYTNELSGGSYAPYSTPIDTGDKTLEDFLKRIQDTCGGKRG